MICSFCSLLCDLEPHEETSCSRRVNSLVELRSIRKAWTSANQALPLQESLVSQSVDTAKKSLAKAKQVLVTGRIASVQTARAAVAFAKALDATIDCTLDENAFANIAAMQRSGMNTVSIAETLDHADMLIIVGDDSILDLYPRMPSSLCSSSCTNKTVLLLGRFSLKSVDCWKSTGADVWSFPLDIQAVPTSLLQWYRYSNSLANSAVDIESKARGGTSMHSSPTDALFGKMATATYTSIVWCSESLTIDYPDLWVERLFQSIAERNETNRCAGLAWASLNGTFQQACTWLTGFPGRIRFRNGLPTYDPDENATLAWLNHRGTIASPSTKEAAVVLYINETVGQSEDLLHSIRADHPHCTLIEITPKSQRFPTFVPGVENAVDIFRSDQCLLAHVDPRAQDVALADAVSGDSKEKAISNLPLRSAADWLEELQR